ncbi:MAG: ASKHA domain-containing protein [Hyphomicrobiales bacterium]|nr:ASKHA domain-containing protein [Hyphomicrobiales bacterium]
MDETLPRTGTNESGVSQDVLAVFLPSGKRGRFPVGTKVLAAARQLGVDIDSICAGRGICGRCQVSVSSGEFQKFGIHSRPENLCARTALEKRYAELRSLAKGRRLSCSAQLTGDAVIDVPAESQLHKQIVRKKAESRNVEIDRVVRLHYVELPPPGLSDQRSDVARLKQALAAEWGLDELTVAQRLLAELPLLLRRAEWRVTAAVRNGSELVALWPGFHDRVFGLAVDIGTTTIAAHLNDLETGEVVAAAGVMNPQIRYGEDLISRVSFIQQNSGSLENLSAAVRRAVDGLARETAATAGVKGTDIIDMSVVGNPIMHHIFLGIDPLQLGSTPFPLVVDEAVTVPAGALGLRSVNPGVQAYLLPCIAGHVGADTAGVILAEAPHRSDEMTLLIDVGTNAEIVLGNRERLLACSSPTGPAFEGAQISCGQRAALGAIERVRIDPDTLAPRFRVIGSKLWSDDPGFAEATADFGVTGICGSGIIEAVAEMFITGIVSRMGLIDGERFPGCDWLEREGEVYSYRLSGGQPGVLITQTDIRAIQLAKAALYAGTRLLMDMLGVETPDRIVLAGAFGSFIDPKHAMILGMIPDCPARRVRAAGNAAGTGARIALLNRATRREIEALVQRIEKVETAADPDFQKSFVAAMALPHARHPFPHLAKWVPLPSSARKHARQDKAFQDNPHPAQHPKSRC